jgi:hypothetical protein
VPKFADKNRLTTTLQEKQLVKHLKQERQRLVDGAHDRTVFSSLL